MMHTKREHTGRVSLDRNKTQNIRKDHFQPSDVQLIYIFVRGKTILEYIQTVYGKTFICYYFKYTLGFIFPERTTQIINLTMCLYVFRCTVNKANTILNFEIR